MGKLPKDTERGSCPVMPTIVAVAEGHDDKRDPNRLFWFSFVEEGLQNSHHPQKSVGTYVLSLAMAISKLSSFN